MPRENVRGQEYFLQAENPFPSCKIGSVTSGRDWRQFVLERFTPPVTLLRNREIENRYCQ